MRIIASAVSESRVPRLHRLAHFLSVGRSALGCERVSGVAFSSAHVMRLERAMGTREGPMDVEKPALDLLLARIPVGGVC